MQSLGMERNEYRCLFLWLLQYRTRSICPSFFFFFQALNFLVESFGLLNDLIPFLSILDAGYPVLDLHLADVLFDVLLLSVLGSSL
jgi:hypothetical protein